jgi:hypothetical protein
MLTAYELFVKYDGKLIERSAISDPETAEELVRYLVLHYGEDRILKEIRESANRLMQAEWDNLLYGTSEYLAQLQSDACIL